MNKKHRTILTAITFCSMLLMGCESRLDRHHLACAELAAYQFLNEDLVEKFGTELNIEGDFQDQYSGVVRYCNQLVGRR